MGGCFPLAHHLAVIILLDFNTRDAIVLDAACWAFRSLMHGEMKSNADLAAKLTGNEEE
jgi:hypothetical protein